MKENGQFERFIKETLKLYTKNYPKELKKGIFYAVAGGKRIRPKMLFSLVKKDIKIPKREFMKIALAIELIHNFSLVHDDLPAIDNDDYRRGRLATHKVFGDGNAILIGDALFALAFQLLSEIKIEERLKIEILKILSKTSADLVKGEYLDINKKNLKEKEYKEIIRRKTGSLFRAVFEICALILKRERKAYAKLGENYGIMYQINDDIKDNLNLPFLPSLKIRYQKKLKPHHLNL